MYITIMSAKRRHAACTNRGPSPPPPQTPKKTKNNSHAFHAFLIKCRIYLISHSNVWNH